jgi:hypothetical protein
LRVRYRRPGAFCQSLHRTRSKVLQCGLVEQSFSHADLQPADNDIGARGWSQPPDIVATEAGPLGFVAVDQLPRKVFVQSLHHGRIAEAAVV